MADEKKHTSLTMTYAMYTKIEGFLSGTKSVSQFCFEAVEEKLKRMEVRDKTARKQLHEKDVKLFEDVIVDVMKQHGVIK